MKFHFHALQGLLRTLALMNRPQGVTISDLEDEFGISRRTAQRLLSSLQDMGLPVYEDSFPGDNKKHFLLMEHKARKFGDLVVPEVPELALTEEEALLLLIGIGQAAQTVGEDHPAVRGLRQKLGILGEDTPLLEDRLEALEILFTASKKGAKDYSGKIELMQDLTDAVLDNQACQVTYNSFSGGTVKTYEVHPLKLLNHHGGVYLFVNNPKYGKINLLAVERIQNLTLLGTRFTRPKDFDAEALLEEAFDLTFGDPLEAEIRFTAQAAPYVLERQWCKRQTWKPAPDGGGVLHLSTSGLQDVKRWVLSFGAQAEVLAPPELKSAVEEEIRAILKGRI